MIKRNRMGLASFAGAKLDISLNNGVVKLLSLLVGHCTKDFLYLRYFPPPAHSIANSQKYAGAKGKGANRQKHNIPKVANPVSRKEQVIYERKRSCEKESDDNTTPRANYLLACR